MSSFNSFKVIDISKTLNDRLGCELCLHKCGVPRLAQKY